VAEEDECRTLITRRYALMNSYTIASRKKKTHVRLRAVRKKRTVVEKTGDSAD